MIDPFIALLLWVWAAFTLFRTIGVMRERSERSVTPELHARWRTAQMGTGFAVIALAPLFTIGFLSARLHLELFAILSGGGFVLALVIAVVMVVRARGLQKELKTAIVGNAGPVPPR